MVGVGPGTGLGGPAEEYWTPVLAGGCPFWHDEVSRLSAMGGGARLERIHLRRWPEEVPCRRARLARSCCREPAVPWAHVSAMLPVGVPLACPGPSVLVLLQLLLSPTSAFFPNIWSLLAAPGSVTHQDLTEEAALNVTLQLFLEQPPPGRPPLCLQDFLVSTPVPSPGPWL